MTDGMSTMSIPTLRQGAAIATRDRILRAAIEIMSAGKLPSMRGVANAAAISERTVYRHFENLDALKTAIQTELQSRGHVPLPTSVDRLEEYAADLYDRFEENSSLIVGLVAMATGDLRALFTETRRKNMEWLHTLLTGAYPRAPREEVDAASASLRTLLSGGGWTYQRISCGMQQDAVVRSAQWALRRALDRLDSF